MQLARALRERFLAEMAKAAAEFGEAVQERLNALRDEPANAREAQMRRDVWVAYQRARALWTEGTVRAWRASLAANPVVPKPVQEDVAGLELVGVDVVESKILASRLVQLVNDHVSQQLDDLRVRMRFLENREDFDAHDLLRPDVSVQLLVEQWAKSGMPSESWTMVSDAVQRVLVERLSTAYKNANELLVSKGVMPTIELKDRVRGQVRTSQARPTAGRDVSASGHAALSRDNPDSRAFAPTGRADFVPSAGAERARDSGPGDAPSAGLFGGRLGWGASAPPVSTRSQGLAGSSSPAPFWRQSTGGSSQPGQAYSPSDETRMLTANTPIARARSRAQGVLGQIRRLFASHAGGDFANVPGHVPSPALVAAIAPHAVGAVYASGGTLYQDFSPAGVARVADDLRERSAELKKKAETKGEKATIEIVALMFQAILAEERIPSGIRVWFARLQMPVLRVALEDPDFFGTADHPARKLIDRMGSCVMGFDAVGVQAGAMETEVKRIVQVVEQYPETGKKVYQIVYEEFQKFLSKFLTEKGPTQQVVSVAQQVEQRETLTIQYTIEMRNMLKDMPVRDEIRDFLFKVWAEVLAVAAVRKGPQHADALLLKKSATDLIWAASAKPNRVDRARVIQELPNLLLRLRSGMTLLAMAPSEQEGHVKRISDTLADAFMSKTQAIPQAQIDAMAQRLSNLEDFVSEDGMGDLPLDAESIEMMLGIDASAIEVVAQGGSKPTAAMLAWAQELQLGTWYTLDHKNQIIQVQFAWRSARKHLNLFASSAGKSFLIQGGRLAAYLQAGLLLPQEEEALTVRATRDALSKIEANPERLLA